MKDAIKRFYEKMGAKVLDVQINGNDVDVQISVPIDYLLVEITLPNETDQQREARLVQEGKRSGAV